MSALERTPRCRRPRPRRKLTPTTSDESSALSGKASEGLGAPRGPSLGLFAAIHRGAHRTPRPDPRARGSSEAAAMDVQMRDEPGTDETPARRRGGPRSPPRRRRRAFHPHAHAAGHEPARDALDTVDAPRAASPRSARPERHTSTGRRRPPRALPRVQLGRSATRARDAAPGNAADAHRGAGSARGSRSSSRTRRTASLVSRRAGETRRRRARRVRRPPSPLAARTNIGATPRLPGSAAPSADAQQRPPSLPDDTRGGGAAASRRLQPTLRRHWRAAAELHPGRRVVGVRAAGAVPDAQRAGGAEEGARREARAAGDVAEVRPRLSSR